MGTYGRRSNSINPASALRAGTLSVADFVKLATVPDGTGMVVAKYSPVIDLVNPPASPVALIPATSGRIARLNSISFAFWHLVTVGGTRSVAPTYSIGANDPDYDNIYASQAGNAALLTQAANTQVTGGTALSPFPDVDITASGVKVKITAGITGTAPVCTARLVVCGVLVPV